MKSVSEILSRLNGQVCWGVEWDCNVNLSMSFGDPILTIREPATKKFNSPDLKELFSSRRITVKGKWWLWVFCSYWKITFPNHPGASSSSSYRQKRIAMAKLDGQRLCSVQINPQTGATQFDFDLGGKVNIRRFDRNSNHDLWMLYEPDGYVLTIRGDGQYSYQPGNQRKEKLLPLKNAL
jgi:hypothetical protein